MIFIDEIEYMKLYKKPFHLPINEDNKKQNSIMFLLNPDYQASKKLLLNKLLINRKYYKSYYIEKDITYYINNENALLDSHSEILNEYTIKTTKDNRAVHHDRQKIKNKIKYEMNKPKNKFVKGIPSKEDNKPELSSDNVTTAEPKLSNPEKTNPKISSESVIKNPLYGVIDGPEYIEDPFKGVKEPGINRALEPEEDNELMYMTESEKIRINNDDSYYIDEGYMRCKVDNNDVMFVFNENLEDYDSKRYNKMLYKILYRERLKTNKDVFEIYNNIKQDVPWIKRTFINYKRYKNLNLIVDLFFYNQAFFKNNIYRLDKGVNLYFDFINRFINDKRFVNEGYTKKTVFVPLESWYNPDKSLYMYNKDINPISMIFRIAKKDPSLLQMWKGIDFLFITDYGYFKLDLSTITKQNLPKLKILINKLLAKIEIPEDNTESKKAIVSNIIDKIEDADNIKINNLTGDGKSISKKDLIDKVEKAETTSTPVEKDRKELVDKISKAAETSKNTDEAIETLNHDETIAKIIQNLSNEEDDTVKINAARASRINKLQDKFLSSEIKGNTIKDMIDSAKNNKELPSSKIDIDTVNEEWNDMKYINFEKVYDVNQDIVSILTSLSEKSHPIVIRDLNVENTSTSEDFIDTWTVKCEDYTGNRFTLKFDIPRLIDNKFLKLRGNRKTINGQLIQIPISKTDEDTVQIVSNYNKIFIRRFGTTTGKSFVIADRLIKTIHKCDTLKVSEGDNSQICSKYELPIDYVDLASTFSIIETERYIIYFNQDEIREKYKIDEDKGIPVVYDKKLKRVLYFDGDSYVSCSSFLISILYENEEFMEKYKTTNKSTRYTYSKASILNTKIPLVVVMGYNEGLEKVMKKAKIKYQLSEKRIYDKKNDEYDYIEFNDGYLTYDVDYNSSLLMNGLKECNTEDFSLSEMNNKSMFLEFLELFGTRILADGLDTFYDCMIDDITKEVLEFYKLPTDYIEVLAYANMLLCDNKYIEHTDMEGRRYRSNEIIAGYAYKAIAESYGNYLNEIKRRGSGTMTIKQTSILDKILLDPTASDVSTLNDLSLLEAINTVSFKGLSGMNSDRSYGLDKRTYDKSMLNLLGLSTGFAGNVGISRQATLDMNVQSKRGYLKLTKNPDKLNITKTFTATEALTPFGVTHDDPFRSAMTFIQTSKHGMRIKNGMPSLISNGADQALPYLTPNIFSYKAKYKGKVVEKTKDYLIIKYDNGTSDFVDLRNKIEKNSNGGFYISLKLDSDLKVGSKVKPNDIVAYDKLSYSDCVGDTGNIAYNLGALTKIAVLGTDEGFEDSAIISEWLSDIMSSEVTEKVTVTLDKNSNIYNMVKKGQPIQEGDPLLIFQNAFEDEDINILLKNLANDEKVISDLGRIPIKSTVTGVVEDIKIYRTVEKEELSDSLKKKVNEYEKEIKNIKKVMKKHGIEKEYELEPDYKLEQTGKLKNLNDGVLIEFFLKYDDKMGVGDKLIYYSALKGVAKQKFPKGKEPRSEFRKDEAIHTLLSCHSVNKRMVCSILVNIGINKNLIELDRKVKDIFGIKWEYLDEMIK